MTIGLLLTALALSVASWLMLMFVWWRKESGTQETLASKKIVSYTKKMTRLVRRGWYVCGMYGRALGSWGNKKASDIFFKLFPSAIPAFAKRDELAGLYTGPSSYFLLSISESKKKEAMRTNQKIVS